MTTESEDSLLDTQGSLAQLQISSPVVAHDPEPNPWQDTSTSVDTQAKDHEYVPPRTINDISVLDPTTAQGLAAEPELEPEPAKPQSRPDILQEFDPLVSHEEQAAKEAWETSDRKSTRLNSSHERRSRMPSSA